jgi:hypothetical protein
MYNRNNYLVKTPSGIYKNKDAIYRSDATVSDLVVSQPHTYRPFAESDTTGQSTKINFLSGSKIPSLTIRIKYA